MPRYLDIQATVLIVVGRGVLAEQEDRPLAYELRRAITERARGADGRAGVVVTDAWMQENDMADFFPAIALGGPAVNTFTAELFEALAIVYSRGRRVFIQMAADAVPKRAAVWGVDQEGTRAAAQAFVADGHLDRFLDLVWRRPG